MANLPLLVNIVGALASALVGGLVARRLGMSTIVGYLVAGVAIGPFTAGFHADEASIHQLAELGVILLMFGVGLHFSFRDLWLVRDIAMPGALLQMAAATAAGYALSRATGTPPAGSLVIGLAVSVASTVVLLRNLMDTGLLDTLHGRVTVGWLVFEDLATIVILVLLPLLTLSSGGSSAQDALYAVGKALVFVVLMLTVGPRLVPAILGRIVKTRSRELFVLVALTAAAGTALVSAGLFGVSLALGAFLAGVVVGESPFSHQIGADLLPFREAFAVLFFVSIGMLVNPMYLMHHWPRVLAFSMLIVFGKFFLTVAGAFLLPYPARTSLVAGAGRSQIGEFSFILGQSGVTLGLISTDDYALILAGALVSISVNPLMFKLMAPVERQLRRWPAIWRALDRPKEDIGPSHEGISNHVVIVGCGRVGRHIAEALGRLEIPRLVVEADPRRLDRLHELGVPVLYGDAGSSDILENAHLNHARALVITLPDDAAALSVVVTARQLSPDIRIVSRASTWDGARRLKAAGTDDVVRPELEGGVEIVRRTLLDLELPVGDVQRYTDLVRREGLDESERPSPERARVLEDLVGAGRHLQVGWLVVQDGSRLSGATLADSGLRASTGVSVVAIGRDGALIGNPSPEEVLHAGDRLAVIGTPAQVSEAETRFSRGSHEALEGA